ncbi:MAG: hypothetical protein U5J82_03010 [Desulfobacterales bacterium]|nr:hypothetical protein [Desulfobacterales bacterium]
MRSFAAARPDDVRACWWTPTTPCTAALPNAITVAREIGPGPAPERPSGWTAGTSAYLAKRSRAMLDAAGLAYELEDRRPPTSSMST